MKKKGQVDRPFVIALMILVGFGLLMVFSASMYSSTVSGEKGYIQFLKQFLFVIMGIALMFYMSRIDYRRYNSQRFSYIFGGVTLVLLVLVLIPGIGMEVNNARRWINLGFTGFQPSELAKVAGIIYMANLLIRKPEVLDDRIALWGLFNKDFIIECLLPMGLACILTALEPSLSAAMAIGMGMLAVLIFGGVRFKWAIPYGILVFVGLIGLIIIEPWRIDRFKSFLGMGGTDYQITQSLLAIGTGGIFGQGLGNGKQKLLFLPELQNDFIFANIGEEFGLIGCVFVLGLFAFIIWRGFKIAMASPDRFGFLYTSSVMFLLGFQVFVNVGVATKTIPVTGMALPFVSAGGTSMLVLFGMLGPILNLSRKVDITKRKKKT